MKLANLLTLISTILISPISQAGELMNPCALLSLDIDKIAHQEHLRMLYKQPEFRKTFKEMDRFYLRASECTIAIPEDISQNIEAFNNIFDPELVLTSSSDTHDLDTWHSHYCKFLSKQIERYQTNLNAKKKWLNDQTKPYAVLLFIMKKWSQAVARFTLGCACYLVGGFTAKYALQEKELKGLGTSLGLFVGGSYFIGEAAVGIAECIHYPKIVEAHAQEADLHANYLKKKNKKLKKILMSITEKKSQKTGSQVESPLIPRDSQKQFEEGTV